MVLVVVCDANDDPLSFLGPSSYQDGWSGYLQTGVNSMLLATAQGRPDAYDGLQTIDYAAVILYFIIMLLAGYYFSRKQRSTEEYFLAGRSMPWFVVGVLQYLP